MVTKRRVSDFRMKKAAILREAYASPETMWLVVANKTTKALNISVEVGNSWDWEVLEPGAEKKFPTNLQNPLLTLTHSVDDNYFELVETVDVASAYDLVVSGTSSFAVTKRPPKEEEEEEKDGDEDDDAAASPAAAASADEDDT